MNGTSSRIVIVGAGIVGASIAYHLARQGQRVIVVEQAYPAAGATGSSFGWISEGVPEGAPDAFLRREIVADWVRLTQEIPALWVNWSGALSYGQAPATQNPGNRRLSSAEVMALEPALGRPDSQAYFAARDGAVDHDKAHQLALDAAFLLRSQCLVTDERGLLPADNPAEVGLQHRCGVVDVVTVQTHGRFQTQRVARSQSAGDQAVRLAGLQQKGRNAAGVTDRGGTNGDGAGVR